jgi:hypothetical protein
MRKLIMTPLLRELMMESLRVGLLMAFFFVSLSGPQAFGANLMLPTGGVVTVEFSSSSTDASNTLSVRSPIVTIATSTCQLASTQGLLGVPLLNGNVSQSGCQVELDADPTTPGIQPFAAGTTLEFGLCVQIDAQANPNCQFDWSSDPTKNFDHLPFLPFDHVNITESSPGQVYELAWEDLPFGGDRDF